MVVKTAIPSSQRRHGRRRPPCPSLAQRPESNAPTRLGNSGLSERQRIAKNRHDQVADREIALGRGEFGPPATAVGLITVTDHARCLRRDPWGAVDAPALDCAGETR
jgi:hypothetical protein